MKKNVLYLHTHDTGRYISPYGYNVNTPNLMKFASQSILFRQAYDCGPTCSPARAALTTGQYPHQCGILGLTHRGFQLNDPQKHISNFLKQNGYKTVLCGIQHEASRELSDTLGYDEVYQDHSTKDWLERDLNNVRHACNVLATESDKPLFMSVGLFSTHRPFPVEIDSDINVDYLKPPFPIPDNKECRTDWAQFMTMAKHADRCFGEIFETLEKLGLNENTMVLVTTDHGPAFPKMKCNLNDVGCGVMFMLKVPAMEIEHGVVNEALISHLDFFPTVCDWANLERPDWLEGQSLIPLLKDEVKELHEEVFSEISFHAAREVTRSLRTKRFRYTCIFDDYENVILPNIDDCLTKTFLLEHADLALQKRGAKEKLFDLNSDMSGIKEVTEDPFYSDILKLLRDRLVKWMTDTNDPVLQGKIVKPEKAFVNLQSSISPNSTEGE